MTILGLEHYIQHYCDAIYCVYEQSTFFLVFIKLIHLVI